MISTGFDSRVKIQQIIENQLPEFIVSENPKVSEFLRQYYISQEFQGGAVDLAENIDQYLNLNNLTPEVISGVSTLTSAITSTDSTIYVDSVKGYPPQYGLLKINNEIITYTGITANSFTGCVRGFSGIVSYRSPNNPEELEFSTSKSSDHPQGSVVENLSSLFLKEFYKKLKKTLAPGFEDVNFVSDLNINNFIKQIKSFYQSKGTEESFRILYNILYGIDPTILNLEDLLIKPSDAEFIRREVIVTELISGENPNNLVGQIIRNFDNTASAPVSEVEIIKRSNKNYYKIQLFAGFNEKSLIEGTFEITPKTKVSDTIHSADTVITVDSTIGFPQSGTLVCNNNIITYSDKTINQFFNCSGIQDTILPGSDIRSDKIVYGYENGDLNKKVELRITGVLSNLKDQNNINFRSVNDNISVKNLGDKIQNPETNKTEKELIFNSWIYNTSSRYEILSFNNNQVALYETPDKSSLKIGDSVNILNRNSEDIVVENAIVTTIINNLVSLNKNITNIPSNTRLSLRKNINYVSSSSLSLKHPKIVSDVQNTYNENDKYIYVASNSLPSYNISKSIVSKSLNITSLSDISSIFSGSRISTDGSLKYSIISFDSEVPFITGDAVIYEGSNNLINGLNYNQVYYVEVIQPSGISELKNKIRLYNAKSFIETNNYVEFDLPNGLGTHTFTLESQLGTKKLAPKKILRKLPLSRNIQSGIGTETIPGPVGILINGVEIINYKSNNRVYYGPLSEVKVINQGFDYDIIDPPTVVVSNPTVSGGTTALINVSVRGNLKQVLVDPNEVDIRRVISASLSGGNGSGAVLEPILQYRYRDINFNGQLSTLGGGVDVTNESITFLNNHLLETGTPIVYNQNGNRPLGIGTAGGSNTDQGRYLTNGSIYYPKIINTRAIQLYGTLSDLNSGINTIGFTTANTGGIHKFRLLEGKNILTDIKVVNSGDGYENRTLRVNPTGISTVFSTVNFKNHGFKNGDLINYETSVGFGYTTGSPITGLSTTKQYYVIKIDESSFRLAEAGDLNLPPTQDNFNRKNHVQFKTAGLGQQIFKYPPIKLNLEVEYAGTIGTITATPILKGKIVDAYLYEPGTDYGSRIVDFERKPIIKIKNGLSAQLNPIIINGSIVGVDVQNGGSNYTSSPNLIINGSGLGAKLRAVVNNGRITKVIVLNGGSNYNQNNTTIRVDASGKNAVLDCKIRFLTINNEKRFSDEILLDSIENSEDLFYGVVGYSTDREGIAFLDPNPDTKHSKIIGWSYDGNPIYGPYGHSDPTNNNSQITLLKTSYESNLNNVFNRPSGFDLGFFVEDYKYTASGDLDIYNGRYAKTPEFPNGVYAYYVGITTDLTTNKLVPKFPYFIGNQYRSTVEVDINANQDYNFNDSNLCRNTFPYRISQLYSGNDFIIEPNKLYKQISLIESVSDGSVESIKVLNPGDNYAVGDSIIFDNEGTGGGGASAVVKSILGKEIVNLETSVQTYENALITRKNSGQIEVKIDPYHDLLNGDSVQISGVSTNTIKNLASNHIVGVVTEYSSLIHSIPPNAIVGLVTDIYISPFPSNVSVGTTIKIGTETLSVLNVFGEQNILRVSRGISGSGHTSATRVNFYPNTFLINLESNYFNSSYNQKVYFNPVNSIGLGTISGNFTDIEFYLGTELKNISVESQSIYLPNHSFKTNQRVLFKKPSGFANLTVRDNPSSSNFNFPSSGDSQYVYVINKSKDFIGIVTEVGLTTSTNGLYFIDNADDNNLYSFESTFDQITATVKKITAQVSISTFHNLSYGDDINLVVKPNLLAGVGAGNSIKIKYNSTYDKLLVNPIGFTSTGINTSKNQIYIPSHNLTNGQKVFYDSGDLIASGLSTGGYFVYRIDNDYIHLCDTYLDVLSLPPKVVSIGGTGGSLHELSLINPQLKITKNNDIIFDLSSSTLDNYEFKLFFDENQKNRFVSIGNTSEFLVSLNKEEKKLTVGFSTFTPAILYYNLEKNDGSSLVTIDDEVQYASQILYIDSVYNGEYKVFGVGSTTFNINLNDIPEKYTYRKDQCDILEYTTKSRTTTGGISEVDIISEGSNYITLPTIIGVSTLSLGSNAILKPDSTNIGKIEQLRILNEGFEYSSDKTLRVKAQIPRSIRLQSSEKLSSIIPTFGGKNFLSTPILTLVNDFTRKKVTSGLLLAKLRGSAIIGVDIIEEPKGLESVNHTIFTEKNSNGVGVERVLSYVDGIVTCELSTPAIDGFLTPPFAIGDYVFVEGIAKQSFTSDIGVITSPGTGFNSRDQGYRFFKVVNYINSNPAILSYDIGEYTDNAGVPVSIQIDFTSIVNKKNYPTFSVNRIPSLFFKGEKLLVNGIESDLVIETSNNNYITVSGEKPVKYNDTLEGTKSGNLAIVDQSFDFTSEFEINYSNKKNYGWKNDIGKLNNELQVIPDNDYYQNLSYSIKTTGERYKNNKVINFDTIKDSINRLVHPTGLKNFADVGITSSATVGIGSNQYLNQILDFVSEKRVDTFNNFDLVLDYDPTTSSSDAIIFRNKKLSDYIECISNRVLQIDDISGQFSSQEFNRDDFVETYEYSVTDLFSKFLVQVSDENKRSIQTSELVVLNNYNDTYTLNKVDLYTGDTLLGNLSGSFASNGNMSLRFDPIDPINFNYNIKIYRDYFSSSQNNIGVGFTDFGFLRLNSRIENFASIGITTDIFRAQASSINSVYANVFILNNATLDMNYFEVLAHHDGNTGNISEYYFDTENNISGSSFGFIGTFGVSVNEGIFKLNFTNNTNNPVTVKTKVVGFGTISAGIDTYRFLVDDQEPGTEKSARLESSYQVSVGSTEIVRYQLTTEGTLKSLVKVSTGSTTVALHQFLVISDLQNVNIQNYPFLAVGTASTSGIGTFGAFISNGNVIVNFYPDPEYSSENITIQKFNQFIYLETDEFNIPYPLTYGIGIEELQTSFYGSLNNFGKDRLSFELNYGRIPIFEKTFNPNRSNILDKETGVFTIPNHFFQSGEELAYTPDTTIISPIEPIGIGSTLVGGQSFIGDFITGFSTITGVGSSEGIILGSLIDGDSIPANSTITSIGSTYTYFVGNVVSGGSTVISGIANTIALSVGSGIYSGDNTSLGNIVSIGINSITSSSIIPEGDDRVYYSTNLNFGITISQVSTATTVRGNYTSGIITDICPSTVYAIRIDNDTFKITGTKGESGIGFTFTSSGSGNAHRFEMKKKLEKSLITVNGVNQYPLIWTPIKHNLQYNGGSIGVGITFIALSGISSIAPKDLIKVDDEFLGVINVGFGTTSTGPVTGLGTIPIIQVNRGFVGTSATTHLDGTEVRVYRGSYNITRNKIHFTEAPDGKGNNNRLDSSGLALPKSTFNGRVFLRKNYETNKIYDDISEQFSGIGRTFNLTKEGSNTSGIEPGSGLVFINDVFQTPDTENNAGNNYTLESVGITTITFTSITRPNTEDVIIVPYDVNQNQIPRGGIIVSLGSSGGLGYAPLVGASVTAIIGAGGSITAVGVGTTDICGSGYRGPISIGITDSSGIGASIRAIVGAGGSLSFEVINGGSGYESPVFKIDDPSYDNLSIVGVSRLSVGNTTTTGIGLSITLNIGPHSYEIPGKNADAAKLINANKELIAQVAVGRMLTYFPGFSVPGGNQNCIDDVVDVLESTCYNLKYGGNDKVYEAAKIYIDNPYLSGEETESIYAFEEVRDMAIQAMRNEPIVTKTITSGRNADAARLIDANKTLIAEVAVGRMLAAFPGFSVTPDNQACIDDIVDVLETIVYNLKYGGNEKVYDAAEIYLNNTYLSGEESESAYAFEQARDMAIQAMRNDPITIGGYSALSQYFDNTIEGDISGLPGVYNVGDCSDVASAITQFVGIVTTTILDSYIPASRTESTNYYTALNQYFDNTIEGDISGLPGVYNVGDCSDVASAITQFVGIVTVAIGNSSLPTKTYGEGSLFEVESFAVTKPGYSFQRGDKFKVVGLVTDSRLNNPISELIFTVDEIFTDSFACWQLGELDYIDSIKSRQNGSRTRFPLFRNGELLSFEKNRSNPESSLIDFDSVLLIYINGVMQEPGVSYKFEGGTTFRFTEPPKPEDNVAIFFYRGTRDIDSVLINVQETVKPGDTLQINARNDNINTVAQTDRVISLIASADLVETGIYLGDGIDSINEKPVNWSKQKSDLIINENIEFKSRDSLETLVVPAAKVIKNVSSIANEIFVDSAQLFNYEENESSIEIKNFEGILIVPNDPISASFTANVSAASTISSITIENSGSGYIPNSILDLKISSPVGIGSIATATASVSSSGSISTITITNPGFGYTSTNLPQIICPTPLATMEMLAEIQFAEGYSGIITGITTTVGTGSNPLALKFYVEFNSTSDIDSLKVGYPIVVGDTSIGIGATSIDTSDNSIVGIGTTFLDNIYVVHDITRVNLIGEITCNILSSTNTVGLSTSDPFSGRFSWGRLSGITRSSSPVSIAVSGYTVNSGLTTFPQILRRGYGLRNTGALAKILPTS